MSNTYGKHIYHTGGPQGLSGQEAVQRDGPYPVGRHRVHFGKRRRPGNNHTHSDNHIFIVVDGEVRIVTGDREIIAGKDQSVFVDGMTPHSIWNNGAKTAVVIKISTAREDAEI